MHVRLRSIIGMPVLEDGGDHALGAISGILIHPDTGKIEGFYVAMRGMFGSSELFFGSEDIVSFGTRVYLRNEQVLAPPDDRVRIAPLLADPRTFLGQRIRTVSGAYVGKCTDVQINTDAFQVEWLFPRRWLKWGVALPVTDIMEVTPQAIIVRDPLKAVPVPKQKEASSKASSLPEIETALPG